MDCRPQGAGGRLCLTLQRAMSKEALKLSKGGLPRVPNILFPQTDFLGNILTFARKGRI